ncbi:sialate O-acetylesterase [Acinetobacter gerneri]|uniref:Sialate O-acetylesterase domain-containing protein n=1 Tax=Acinetobacter gerneri DSM 14967 = CIP 107464 = MTCC 9824 TaxID=1120926 RepID=N8YB87_9GAMM|nr:sialate O-acetylesterase [Acinetobacter gerneri]ENV33921.1 hypothetical protein F960_01927 [Acinetobacter gerneri DSM 14967 = CIP 107464 = MTCC 9824]EPR82798.1 hypothetical protein L289_2716 [Acinetobacter gerneri DSM 14967 = CIP 107464 = MTCC 9824]
MTLEVSGTPIGYLARAKSVEKKDVLPIVQEGVTKQVEAAQVVNLVTNNLGSAALKNTEDFASTVTVNELKSEVQGVTYAVIAISNGADKSFPTYAEMIAYKPAQANVSVRNNDPDPNLRGTYIWTGTEYVAGYDTLDEAIKLASKAKSEAIDESSIYVDQKTEDLKYLKSSSNDEYTLRVLNKFGFTEMDLKLDGSLASRLFSISKDTISTAELSLISKSGAVLEVVDRVGRTVTVIDENAQLSAKSGLIFNNESIESSEDFILGAKDKYGRTIVIIDKYGYLQNQANTTDYEYEILKSERNALNLSYSEKVRSNFNSQIQRTTANLNHFLWYGQSLASNAETFPALSKTAYENLDNLMLGDSSKPRGAYDDKFTPLNNSNLNPLKAVVQAAGGNGILTDAEIAALEYHAQNEGEGAVACINSLKQLFLKYFSLSRDQTRKFVLSNCASSGQTIDQLSKGNSANRYNRLTQAINQVRAIAEAQSLSYTIPALILEHGQFDSANGMSKTDYKSKVLKLFSDFTTDFCANQDAPSFFITQVGGAYGNETHEVASAQLELSKENLNIYGVCPEYFVADKGGHLTSNGARWLDCVIAKVMFRVLVLGEGWQPLHCINMQIKDDKALLSYHVPYPPLQFKTPFTSTEQLAIPNQGFVAEDENGSLVISSVEIIADTLIEIKFTRKVVGSLTVYYARKSNLYGAGCLCDSDPFVSTEKYIYLENSGMAASENIASLVNKPYPNQNWAFAQKIVASE